MRSYIKNYVKIFVTIFSSFFFSPLAKGKKKSKTKIILSGNSYMPSIKAVVNILPVQVSVMISLILITKSNCIGYGGLNKKFCKAFYMTFRKANTHKSWHHWQESNALLLWLVFSSVTVGLITAADVSYFLSL